MPRYFLRLSFKGTAYAGWQIQANAVAVQEKINNALSILYNYPVITIGCGRTDTGVHASQFYLHFDLAESISNIEKMLYSINALLPLDIAVQELIEVDSGCHARFDASKRTYDYYITGSKNPFLREFSMFTPALPDIALMEEACKLLVREDDFSSFSKSNTQVKTNICHIINATWQTRNDLLVFTISADRFLRGMVRAIVGTMLDVGSAKISPGKINEIIKMKNRSEAGVTVPASGLFLSRVEYPYIVSPEPFRFPG